MPLVQARTSAQIPGSAGVDLRIATGNREGHEVGIAVDRISVLRTRGLPIPTL